MYEILIMVIASFHLLCYILAFVTVLYTILWRATAQIENIYKITFCNKYSVFKYVANLALTSEKKYTEIFQSQKSY